MTTTPWPDTWSAVTYVTVTVHDHHDNTDKPHVLACIESVGGGPKTRRMTAIPRDYRGVLVLCEANHDGARWTLSTSAMATLDPAELDRLLQRAAVCVHIAGQPHAVLLVDDPEPPARAAGAFGIPGTAAEAAGRHVPGQGSFHVPDTVDRIDEAELDDLRATVTAALDPPTLYLVKWDTGHYALVLAHGRDRLVDTLDELDDPGAASYEPYTGPLFLHLTERRPDAGDVAVYRDWFDFKPAECDTGGETTDALLALLRPRVAELRERVAEDAAAAPSAPADPTIPSGAYAAADDTDGVLALRFGHGGARFELGRGVVALPEPTPAGDA